MNNSNPTQIEAQLVKNCWLKIVSAQGADAFVDRFYQFMFEHHPETTAFFPANLQSQKIKLLNTLNNVINGIEYIDDLKDELFKLGKQHKTLGIPPEMFENFISIIVKTADTASNSTLSDKELLAWENAFRKISGMMLEAYH